MPIVIKQKARKTPKTKKTQKQKKKEARDEVTALGHVLRGLGGLAGGGLGGLVGLQAQGSGLGTHLGAALSRWLGAGDYTVSQNSIVSRASTGIPMMHKDGQTITVRHREFLMEVTSSQAFSVLNSFPINPGMRSTFPWMSRVAGNFQQYRIKGMVYHYIPTAGNAVSSTNSAMGSVMLQTVYRATDSAPVDKVSLLNEYWTSEVIPSDTVAHPVECNPNENPYNVQYVRSADPPAGESKLLYDLGTTYIATSGQQTTGNVLGDLWVTYEVELMKPIISSDVIGLDPYYGIYYNNPTNFFSAPTAGVVEGNVKVDASGAIMSLPVDIRGTMEMRVYIAGSGLGWSPTLMTPTPTGWTAANMVSGNTKVSSNVGTGLTYIVWCARFLRTSTTTPSYITFPSLSSPVTAGTVTTLSVEFVIRND